MRIGFTLAAIAVAIYALMWVGFRLHWLDAFDSATLRPLHHYGVHHPGWVRFWNDFCMVFGPTGFRVLGTVVIAIALLRRNVRAVLFLLATIWLSGYLTNGAKALAARPRPRGALVHAGFSSFPSGHALEVMAAVLALLTVSACLFGHRVRITTIVVGAVIVIAVGVGRVLLNVHHPTDVIAGWALGYLWFFLCLLVIRPEPLPAPAGPADRGLRGAAVAGKPEAPDTAR